MSNTILTPSVLAKEMLRVLMNECPTLGAVNRNYDKQYAIPGAKIGDTINIRKPPRYTVGTGRVATAQDYAETSVALTLDTQKHVMIQFTSRDLTLSLDDFSERVIQPAIVPLGNAVEVAILDRMGLDTYQAVGTPGTTPATLQLWLDAGAKLSLSSTPSNLRSIVLDPVAQARTVDALKGLFEAGPEIRKQYMEGRMGRAVGFDWYMGQNVRRHTVGPLGGTPLVNGASQSGASLITDGWTASAASRLKEGDIFTIDDVYAVNPVSKQSTGQLAQFVVTADVSSDGSGNLTAAISPAITLTGTGQNVDSLPANNAGINVLGAASTLTPCNLAFHRDSATVGFADLVMPSGVWGARYSDEKTGVSVRLVKQYDLPNDMEMCRFDLLFGVKTLYPEWICRVQG